MVDIEKVSKYISIRSGISEPQSAGRRVLMSLPRVRWLEAQPDYEPWPPLEELKMEPAPEPETEPQRYVFRPQARNYELSDRQREAWKMYDEGLSVKQVAEKMNISRNAASKLLAQAREKLGIGLEK